MGKAALRPRAATITNLLPSSASSYVCLNGVGVARLASDPREYEERSTVPSSTETTLGGPCPTPGSSEMCARSTR